MECQINQEHTDKCIQIMHGKELCIFTLLRLICTVLALHDQMQQSDCKYNMP